MDYLLPNGDKLNLTDGATGVDAATAIGPGLAKAALAIKVGSATMTWRGRSRRGVRAGSKSSPRRVVKRRSS